MSREQIVELVYRMGKVLMLLSTDYTHRSNRSARCHQTCCALATSAFQHPLQKVKMEVFMAWCSIGKLSHLVGDRQIVNGGSQRGTDSANFILCWLHCEDVHCEESQVLYPCVKYSLLGKDRDHIPNNKYIQTLEIPWSSKMYREMVSRKFLLVYMWNKGNSDTKLEQSNEELLGGSVIAWKGIYEMVTFAELKDWSQLVVEGHVTLLAHSVLSDMCCSLLGNQKH